MNQKIITLAIALLSIFSPNSFASEKPFEYPVHILPGSPSEAYGPFIRRALMSDDITNMASYVQQALNAGTRNLQWLDFLNSRRPDQIALTKPGDLPSHPINKPNAYSPLTIENDFKALNTSIPESMRKIIFENAGFTDTLSISVKDYIAWAKKVDKLYQIAARWTSLAPYLSSYARNKVNDIRGYYFLMKDSDLEKKLKNWNSLSIDVQNRLRIYLVNLCENSSISTAQCDTNLNSAITQNDVTGHFAKYVAKSKAIYNRYFKIAGIRRELQWTSQNANLAVIPFRQTDPVIQNFLAVNIEDEWKWMGWQLKLDFQSNAPVHVEFKAGVVPHVNGLGGDTIVMDKNASLNEWDVQWTIRHEFGHVLGFPDCYVEFYDSAAQQMVNYQIDVSDLMCSRVGKFKQNHFSEMKSVYCR